MAYGIMRVEKCKSDGVYGIHKEAFRKEGDQWREDSEGNRVLDKTFIGHDIDWSKTHLNISRVSSVFQGMSFSKAIKQNIAKNGLTPRKDAVVMLDTFYGASPEFFADKVNADGSLTKEGLSYFQKCLEFHKENIGNVVAFSIHLDETTPHMHVESIPYVNSKDKDGNDIVKLCAKDICGGKAAYHERQDKFYEAVSKEFGLERGTVRTNEGKVKHKTKIEHDIEVLKEELNQTKGELTKYKEVVGKLKDISESKRYQSMCFDLRSYYKDLKQQMITRYESLQNAPENVLKELRAAEELLNLPNTLESLENGLEGLEMDEGEER